MSYWLKATGVIERYHRFLKTKLAYLVPKFIQWVQVLSQAVQLPSNQPQNIGDLLDCLLEAQLVCLHIQLTEQGSKVIKRA